MAWGFIDYARLLFYRQKLMKKIISAIFMSVSVLSGAQSLDTQAIISEMSEANASISSISCDFVQTRHVKLLNEDMVSKGRMAYLRPDRLRWEYTSPYPSVFVFNGNKVRINNGGQIQAVDANQSRVFKEIAATMMSFIGGGSFFDSKAFKIDVADASGYWIATLVPQKGGFKQFCSELVLHINKSDKTVRTIIMQESSGDRTTIEMKNTVVNGEVDDLSFVVE